MNTKCKTKLLLIASIFILFFLGQTVNADDPDRTSYDRFCSLVGSALEASEDINDQHQYILERFDETVNSSDLREAYLFSFQLAPERRYIEFKKSIKNVLGADWQCKQLDKYFLQYRYPGGE